MKFIVLDSESDGFWKDATKLHVVAWTEDGVNFEATNDYQVIKNLLSEPDKRIVCHNAVRHDLPLFNKVLGTNLAYTDFVDTLALSWYINFDRDRHGLDSYGKDHGVQKPKVEDWNNLDFAEYKHRCIEDVKINWLMWQDMLRRLKMLYPVEADMLRLVDYLGFKMDCALEAETMMVKLDVERAQKNYDKLEAMEAEKVVELAKAMPKKPIYRVVNKPKIMVKKDGSLSVAGANWVQTLKDLKLPPNTAGPVNVLVSMEDANPKSNVQVKDWLFSNGWEPDHFKFDRNKDTGEERMIPQIRYLKGHPKEGELCDSILVLAEHTPSVEILDGLTVIQHRKGFFKGMLESHKDGWLVAGIEGLTNTFRFKHRKPLANIPKVDKPWGDEIRGCLIAPEGKVLCGADMVSLEDTTKRHYMKPFDPDYVEIMCQPGFDPHLDLAVFAGACSAEDVEKHKTGERSLKALRSKFKQTNYSAVYGIGATKLARETGLSKPEAQKLLDAYWQRNHSVTKAVEKFQIEVIGPYMWLKNPVSGFWHNLRAEKDAFSTANQSTGVYCFDTWLYYVRQAGIKIAMQFHDEEGHYIERGSEVENEKVLREAIRKTNEKLKLNVLLDIDVQHGDNYAQTH